MPRSVSGVIPRRAGAPIAAARPHDCDRAARAVPFLSGQGGCTLLSGGTGRHFDVQGVAYSLQAGSYRPPLVGAWPLLGLSGLF
eukprot:4703975-Lingulodinium_polyedra.AAC.1